MAKDKQSSLWSSMLLEAMWGLDIQSLSVLGGDLDQALFTFCFVAENELFRNHENDHPLRFEL